MSKHAQIPLFVLAVFQNVNSLLSLMIDQHISLLNLAQIFFREGAIVKEDSLILCAPDITSPYTNWQHMVYFLK